jgi:predicted dehydrogenase
MGVIGVGPRGSYVLSHFLKEADVRVVAIADCFADRRAEAKTAVDTTYGNKDCVTYRFHEQILERKDIDAVLIATGDRWHTVLSVLAAKAGKDIYCEKPISLAISEGRALVNAIERYGTVWQCGTQRKSIPGYAFVRDVVRSGRIGKLHTITTSFGDGAWRGNGLAIPEPPPDPAIFDYERWLGQAPWRPYSKAGVQLWRLNWDTSAGPVADMGPHYCEFAQWVRGDDRDCPVEYEGRAEFLPAHQINDIPYFVDIRARWADGMHLIMDSKPKGVRFDGDKGWIQLLDDGAVAADPKGVLHGLTPPEGNWKVMAPHIRNFLDCVRTRRKPVSSAEVAQRAHTIVHCGNLCARLGRKLRWDSEAELFVNDEQANNMLSRTMRAPWRV